MTTRAFGLTMVAIVLALGIVPALVARLKRTLFISDVALVVLPPVLFYASGYYLNSELQVGFGLIIYPFLVGVAAVATLYVRVFLLDHVYSNPRRNSLTCVVVACAVATALGVVIPPLYE